MASPLLAVPGGYYNRTWPRCSNVHKLSAWSNNRSGTQVRIPQPQAEQLKLEQQHGQVDWGQQKVIMPGSPEAWSLSEREKEREN